MNKLVILVSLLILPISSYAEKKNVLPEIVVDAPGTQYTPGYSVDQENSLYIKTLLRKDSDKNLYVDDGGYKDLDEDGVLDKYDFCQNTAVGQKIGRLGCRLDSDGDGIFDENDYCPTTLKGIKVNFLGCELDDDGDGVLNSVDRCPYTKVGVKVNDWGCSINYDADGDGVSNKNDQCPNTGENVLVNKFGCTPTSLTISNVLFDTGIYAIRADQKIILNNETEMLKELQEDEIILLTGFTDTVGLMVRNMQLSWNRAQSVKDYLADILGYNRKSIILVGKGEKYPLNQNITADDRQQNRRVEINIMLKKDVPVKALATMPSDMRNYTRYPVTGGNYSKELQSLQLPF